MGLFHAETRIAPRFFPPWNPLNWAGEQSEPEVVHSMMMKNPLYLKQIFFRARSVWGSFSLPMPQALESGTLHENAASFC
jgi:hypothetical protein